VREQSCSRANHPSDTTASRRAFLVAQKPIRGCDLGEGSDLIIIESAQQDTGDLDWSQAGIFSRESSRTRWKAPGARVMRSGHEAATRDYSRIISSEITQSAAPLTG
jgi:hypothetical protein